MKKVILFVITLIMMTACVTSEYSVRYVDMGNPTDTLTTTYKVHGELGLCEHDVRTMFYVQYKPIIGEYGDGVCVYMMKTESVAMIQTLYTSANPITIIDVEYVGGGE